MTIRFAQVAAAAPCDIPERKNFGLLLLLVFDLLNLRLLGVADRLAARYSALQRGALNRRFREYSLDVWRQTLAAMTPAALLLAAVFNPGFSALAAAAILAWMLHVMDETSGALFALRTSAQRMKPSAPRRRASLRSRPCWGRQCAAQPVDLEGVSFVWPGARKPALDNVSLTIEPGEFICLAGPSGSGKSTMIRLMLGLERPTRGQIAFDGEPLRALDIETVRSQMECISQEERLIDGSVRTNILGVSQLGLNDAWQAAHLACVADMIRAMPSGMMTFATQNLFSGGERQRLFIARAIARRPAILFLDETLSGLDEELQSRIIANLRTIPEMTCIIASHRPSLAAAMDRTLRFDHGRIVSVERGNPVRADFVAPPPPPEPEELELFRREAVERFHAAEPLDRIIRL